MGPSEELGCCHVVQGASCMPSSLDQSNEVGAVLRSISDRLADRPEYELARQQLNLAYQGPLVAAQPADACGNRLLDADLLDEATTLYRALVRCFADQPVGFVGLARLAMRRNAWTDALACWDEVINRFVREARPLWRAQRATALLHLGRRAEAEQAFRMLIRTNPEFLPGLLGLLRTLLFMGERERAFLELDASSFCRVDAPALVWTKFEILIGLHRLDDARTEFDRILRAAEDPTLLTSLFAFAPQLYDGWRRTKAWLTLLEKTESFAKRN